ncbi:hypothetical protein DV515_00013154, partial [Chloebia gouldiae]
MPCSQRGPGLNSLLLAKASSFQQQGRAHNTGAARAEVEATGGRPSDAEDPLEAVKKITEEMRKLASTN